jgi:predicted amidohydrolase
MKVKIGLAQITPKLGDVEANLALHLQQIEKAADQGVELLIFPELSLTGYRLRDLTFSVALKPTPQDPVFGRLLASLQSATKRASRSPDFSRMVMWGWRLPLLVGMLLFTH